MTLAELVVLKTDGTRVHAVTVFQPSRSEGTVIEYEESESRSDEA